MNPMNTSEEIGKVCVVCGERGSLLCGHCDSAARYIATMTDRLAIPVSDPIANKAARAVSLAIRQLWRDHARHRVPEVAP
jgi:hypothetical protein